MSAEALRDAVFAKCETRGQQAGLLIGCLFFAAVLAGLTVWLVDLGMSGFATLEETPRRRGLLGMQSGVRKTVWQTVFIGLGGAMVAGLLGLLSLVAGAVNGWRLATGTGIKDV